MEQLLKDIQERLIAEVKQLKYVDEDWGQLDFLFPAPPVQWPCALIDATAGTWSNTGKRGQMGVIQIKIRLGDLRITNSSGKAPKLQQQKAFAVYGYLQAIYKALHGWRGCNATYSALIRTSSNRIKREDGVRIFETTFTCELYDSEAMPTPDTAPKPAVKVQVVRV